MSRVPLAVLPAERLGEVLARRRAERSLSLADVAAGSGFEVGDLEAVEAGGVALDQGRLERVIEVYGLRPEELLPERDEVVVDLDHGQLRVAERTAALDASAPSADQVLGAYLSLVYALRNTVPGTPLVLRQDDVTVLARALRLAEPEVESRLVGLMDEPSTDVRSLHRSLRRRLALPVIGAAVVVVGVVGLVLVVQADDDTPSAPVPTTRPGAIEAPVSTDVSLLPPVSITRDDARPPGPVHALAPPSRRAGVGRVRGPMRHAGGHARLAGGWSGDRGARRGSSSCATAVVTVATTGARPAVSSTPGRPWSRA